MNNNIEFLKNSLFDFGMYADITKAVGYELFHKHVYESSSMKKFIDQIQSIEESFIFLDIGAQFGYYSVCCNRYRRDSEIHAYEPMKENYEILHMNLDNKNNCFIHEYALIGRKFYNTMFIESDSSCNTMAPFRASNIDNYITVTSKRLSEESIDFPKVKIVKIDVEGSEMLILEEAWDCFLPGTFFIMEYVDVGESMGVVKNIMKKFNWTEQLPNMDLNRFFIKNG